MKNLQPRRSRRHLRLLLTGLVAGTVSSAVSSCARPERGAETSEQHKARLDRLMSDAISAAPPTLVVTKVKKGVLTPLEVFRGYDIKVNLTIECQGTPPEWWGQISSQEETERGNLVSGDRPLPRKALCRTAEMRQVKPPGEGRADRNAPYYYSAFYLVNLKGLQGPLTLRDDLPMFWGTKPIPNAVAKVDVPLLGAGEAVKTPIVSRAPGVKIEKLTVEPEEDPGSAKIHITYRPLSELGTRGVKVRVYEAKGKEWRIKPQFDISSAFGTTLGESQGWACTLDLSEVPLAAGPLIARGYVYNGDSWPSPFSVPLRDARGKIVPKAASPVRFRLIETGSEWDTQSGRVEAFAVVSGEDATQELAEVDWTSNPQPTIIDTAGKQQLLENIVVGIRRQPSHANAVRLSWGIATDSLASTHGASGLKFKTWVRADGGGQVPLTVPISMTSGARSPTH